MRATLRCQCQAKLEECEARVEQLQSSGGGGGGIPQVRLRHTIPRFTSLARFNINSRGQRWHLPPSHQVVPAFLIQGVGDVVPAGNVENHMEGLSMATVSILVASFKSSVHTS